MSLICREVTYRYNRHQPPVICSLSCRINPGEAVVLGGANGSGKSTLLKIMAGLYVPTEGQAEMDGHSGQSKRGQLRPGIGLVAANPERYFFAATVEDEIAYGLQNMGIKRSCWPDRAAEALAYTGLSAEFLKRNPFYLSLGEQRRVGIAAILALKPCYLLLDEPFNNLDSEGIVTLARYLDAYVKDGNAVITSSHRAEEVNSWCRRLLVLEAGRLVYDGSLLDWQHTPRLPVLLDEEANLCRLLAAHGINIDYCDDPQMLAAQIVQACQGSS